MVLKNKFIALTKKRFSLSITSVKNTYINDFEKEHQFIKLKKIITLLLCSKLTYKPLSVYFFYKYLSLSFFLYFFFFLLSLCTTKENLLSSQWGFLLNLSFLYLTLFFRYIILQIPFFHFFLFSKNFLLMIVYKYTMNVHTFLKDAFKRYYVI